MAITEEDFVKALDLSDKEDLQAPHGRCAYCGSPFGMPNKDGMIFYRYDSSHICTGCEAFERSVNSRRQDYLENRSINEGRRSGGYGR